MQYVPLRVEILDSPKIMKLAAEVYRFWTFSLLAAQKWDFVDGSLPDLERLAHWLRYTEDECRAHLAVLVDSGLVDVMDGGWSVHDWDDWRNVTDPGAARRMRKMRASKRDEQPEHDRNKAVTVTEAVTRNAKSTDQRADSTPPAAPESTVTPKRQSLPESGSETADHAKTRLVTGVFADVTTNPNPNPNPNPTTPLTPPGGIERVVVDEDAYAEFQKTLTPVGSPAYLRVIDASGERWGSGGLDIAVDLLKTFRADVVSFAADATFDKFGRSLAGNAGRYWRSTCQNHRDGPPAQAPSRAQGRPSAPIEYVVCLDPDDLTPPSQRGKEGAYKYDAGRRLDELDTLPIRGDKRA